MGEIYCDIFTLKGIINAIRSLNQVSNNETTKQQNK